MLEARSLNPFFIRSQLIRKEAAHKDDFIPVLIPSSSGLS